MPLGRARWVALFGLGAWLGCAHHGSAPAVDAAAHDAEQPADAHLPDAEGGAPGADAHVGGDAGEAHDAGEHDASTRDAAAGGDASASDAAASDAAAPSGGLRAQVCGSQTSFPDPLPATDQRKAHLVGSDSFGFLEGPVWLADPGVLLFSDMDFAGDDTNGPPSRIRRLMPPSSYDVFSASSNSNGLALSTDGNVLAATHDNQGLSRFDAQSAMRTPLAVLAGDKHLNSPNDLTVRSDGTVYVTDPDWQLGQRTSETGITGVYRVDPPLSAATPNAAVLIEGSLDKPNGVALSPDEQTLYVGSNGSEIWKYQVAADGSVKNRTKFADTGSSDGMSVDCAGNLYVASGTIEVFAPSGDKLGDITLDDNPSNVAFGGDDRKTLYITAGAHLYAITLNVPGYPY